MEIILKLNYLLFFNLKIHSLTFAENLKSRIFSVSFK